jgi:hypothetical protein
VQKLKGFQLGKRMEFEFVNALSAVDGEVIMTLLFLRKASSPGIATRKRAAPRDASFDEKSRLCGAISPVLRVKGL